MIQDAQGWCTGMTQRDGMGKEVGGGFRMGNINKKRETQKGFRAKQPHNVLLSFITGSK